MVSSTARLGASALPYFTKRFGKNFSANDVFGIDKKSCSESRTMFLAKSDPPPQHAGAARKLLPSRSPHPDPGAARDVTQPTPVPTSATAGTLRLGTRRKASSSLSSITERSLGEFVDSRGLESVGNDSRRSFWDRIEVDVPRLPQKPGSEHMNSPSLATKPLSTPRVGSSLTVDAVPLRAESRLSYYPPAAAIRKVSLPRTRGIHGKRVGTKFVAGLK
jgi:axial budding pattern protein 2